MPIVYKFDYKGFSYIGSTSLLLPYRIKEHRDCMHRTKRKHLKFYNFCLDQNIKMKEFYECFEILDEINIADKKILRQMEQYYIDKFKPNLNMRRAFGDKKKLKHLNI